MLILDGTICQYPEVKPNVNNNTVFLCKITTLFIFHRWATIEWDVASQSFRRYNNKITAWVKFAADNVNTGF